MEEALSKFEDEILKNVVHLDKMQTARLAFRYGYEAGVISIEEVPIEEKQMLSIGITTSRKLYTDKQEVRIQLHDSYTDNTILLNIQEVESLIAKLNVLVEEINKLNEV